MKGRRMREMDGLKMSVGGLDIGAELTEGLGMGYRQAS